jgi:hypothetical protein
MKGLDMLRCVLIYIRIKLIEENDLPKILTPLIKEKKDRLKLIQYLDLLNIATSNEMQKKSQKLGY